MSVETAVEAASEASEALRELVLRSYDEPVARGMIVGAALGADDPADGIERMLEAVRAADA